MEEFQIEIGDKIYMFDDTKSISTTICIRSGDYYFPSQEWWDFPDSLLGMWLHNLISNKEAADMNFEFHFMDGPYKLVIYKDANMKLKIQCVSNRYKIKIEKELYCDFYECVDAVYCAYKRLNYLLFTNNMHKGIYAPIYNQSIDSMKKLRDIKKEC